jgi:hypothetical protein
MRGRWLEARFRLDRLRLEIEERFFAPGGKPGCGYMSNIVTYDYKAVIFAFHSGECAFGTQFSYSSK